MSEDRKIIAETEFFALFSDGFIGVSDGVGYVGDIDPDETEKFIRDSYNFLNSKN